MSRLFFAVAAAGALAAALASGAAAAPDATIQTTVARFPTFWAVVNSNGKFARKSSNVTAVSKLGTGTYEIDFDIPNTDKCAFVGALGNPTGGTPPPGFVSIATRVTNVQGIFVETFNVTGAATDESFHVIMMCKS